MSFHNLLSSLVCAFVKFIFYISLRFVCYIYIIYFTFSQYFFAICIFLFLHFYFSIHSEQILHNILHRNIFSKFYFFTFDTFKFVHYNIDIIQLKQVIFI